MTGNENALSFEQLLEKNIKMVQSNRFMTKEEKAEKIIQLKESQTIGEILFKRVLANPNAAFKGRGAFVKMALKKFHELEPDAFKQCYDLSQPKIVDHDLIPIIIDEAARVYPKNHDNYATLISVCYYLIAPFKNIHQDVKMDFGIRDKIQMALGFANPETVNAQSAYIIPMFKNHRFRAKVSELGDQIFSHLKEAGFINRELNA